MGHGETSVDVAGPSIDERHRNLPARALLSDDSGKASAPCRLTRVGHMQSVNFSTHLDREVLDGLEVAIHVQDLLIAAAAV